MNETTNTGFGHNSGDLPESADPFTQTQIRVDSLVANADRWRKERPEIADAETAGKCSDFIEQLTKQATALDTERLEATKPFRDKTAKINGEYNGLIKRLDVAKDLLRKLLTPWQLAEKKRLEEEAARKEAEALELLQRAEEAKKAVEDGTATVDQIVAAEDLQQSAKTAIKVADRAASATVATRGDFGSRARGLRTVWSGTIIDYDKALTHYKNRPEVRELIQRLADADARSPERRTVPVPGVEFKSQQEAA